MSVSVHTDEFLVQKVGRTAELFPDRPALFIKERYYSYAELFEIVRGIADTILSTGNFSKIAIYCNDDVETYASILALNLCGAAYIPLNKKNPVSRNVGIVNHCKPELILSSVINSDVNYISKDLNVINTSSLERSSGNVALEKKSPNKIAYILYTSGTTGEPKGVPVSNENVNAFFNYFLKHYDFNKDDKFLQVYELTFDVSVFAFFMPLLVGACCYVLPEEGIKPVKTIEYIQKYGITVVSMVPGNLRYVEKYLSEITLPSLRYSFFSGDALYLDQALKWSKSVPNAAIHNCYGPTEATIVCTRYVFEKEAATEESVNGIVPLGKAFEGMEYLIVDENNVPASKGELCFTGTQVIESYLDKTNEDKFFESNNKRYYKTGDLASVNENGNLIFHGRTDSQVKVNGYRVELGEIENTLSGLLNTTCVVLFVKEQLVAFVEAEYVLENSQKEAVGLLLPSYMVPQRIISVKKFERNLHGKMDRNKLLNLCTF